MRFKRCRPLRFHRNLADNVSSLIVLITGVRIVCRCQSSRVHTSYDENSVRSCDYTCGLYHDRGSHAVTPLAPVIEIDTRLPLSDLVVRSNPTCWMCISCWADN